MTKKLAFIINVFREDDFHSGGEKLFYELVVNAIELGYKVDLYCCKYLYSTKEPQLKLNKVTLFGNSKDYKYPDKIETIYKCFNKLISSEQYEHVISENITPPIDIAILQGHSLLHYASILSNPIEKKLFEFKKQKFIKAQEKWLKQGFNKIVVPSNTLKNELVTNFQIDESKIKVAYPGVEIPKKINEISSSLTENNRPIVFGLSAPSFSKKGGYIFIKALKLLHKAGFEFKAKIIYPKANKNILLNLLLRQSGLQKHVEFLPYQENMTSFYEQVDVVVMPSLVETFGLVALEAMARKRAIIVGSCCGASEIIEDSHNGYVFKMKDDPASNLYLKMKNICLNKKNISEITAKGQETAKQFSWENSCKQALSFIISDS